MEGITDIIVIYDDEELNKNVTPDYLLALHLQNQINQEAAIQEANDALVAKNLQEIFTVEVETQNPRGLVYYDKKQKDKLKTSSCLVDPSWEIIDPTPDIYELFAAFEERFFWGRLKNVCVDWSKRMTQCAGVCAYERRGGMCRITLSEPLLKLRPRKDLVETLLHEMIHAYLFVTHNYSDHNGHGPKFHEHMNRINAEAGTKITVYHTFFDEVNFYKTHVWQCDGICKYNHPYYGKVSRSMNRAPGPNDSWWRDHQSTCYGTFHKISEPEVNKKKTAQSKIVKGKGKVPKSNSNGNIKKFVSFKTPIAVDITEITKKTDGNSNTKPSSKNSNTNTFTNQNSKDVFKNPHEGSSTINANPVRDATRTKSNSKHVCKKPYERSSTVTSTIHNNYYYSHSDPVRAAARTDSNSENVSKKPNERSSTVTSTIHNNYYNSHSDPVRDAVRTDSNSGNVFKKPNKRSSTVTSTIHNNYYSSHSDPVRDAVQTNSNNKDVFKKPYDRSSTVTSTVHNNYYSLHSNPARDAVRAHWLNKYPNNPNDSNKTEKSKETSEYVPINTRSQESEDKENAMKKDYKDLTLLEKRSVSYPVPHVLIKMEDNSKQCPREIDGICQTCGLKIIKNQVEGFCYRYCNCDGKRIDNGVFLCDTTCFICFVPVNQEELFRHLCQCCETNLGIQISLAANCTSNCPICSKAFESPSSFIDHFKTCLITTQEVGRM